MGHALVVATICLTAATCHCKEAMNQPTRTSPTRTAIDDVALDALYEAEANIHAVERRGPTPSPRFHLLSYLTGLLTALLLVGGMTLLLRRPEPQPIALQPPPTAVPTATATATPTAAPIVIFVSGAVQKPGMYALANAARVGDALRAAGGLTLQANVALVNQAERLWDGAQVHVPVSSAPTPPESANNGDTVIAPTAPTPPVGISGSAAAPNGRSGLSSTADGLVDISLLDINRASPTELTTLPGIGTTKAAAIVANRPYTTIDELEKVPGIGPKTVEQLRPLVTVE